MDPGTAIAVGEISAKALSTMWKYYSDVKDAKDDIEFLANEIKDFQNVLETVRQLLEDGSIAEKIPASLPLLKTTKALGIDMEALCAQLNPSKGTKTMRRVGLRALKWPLKKKEVCEFVTKLQRYKSTLNLAFLADQTTLMLNIEDERHLAKLPLAADANFDAYYRQHQGPCTVGTRVDLLRRLQDWGTSHEKPIFWLSGMAGTGKSTIARTFADSLSTQSRLGGSFFFSRGSGNLNNATKFVSTLAHQIASRSPEVKRSVCKAIAEHSEVFRQGLRNQWKELIIKPLSMTKFNERPIWNLVIDALDECDSDDDIRLLLQLFVEVKGLNTVDLGIIVTSRPEITIRLGFQHMPEIVHFRLDLRDIPRSIVEHDMTLFLEQELGRIRDERLLRNWPEKEDVQSLVQRSDCLFIYAATVCRFVGDNDWSPKERLLEILQSNSTLGGDTPQLDEMYIQVLNHSLVINRREADVTKLARRFREVVGVIISSFDTLSVNSLANLLSMPVDSIEAALGSLHSVLNIPINMDSPMRLLHPSFRDFLTDEARCGDQCFFINQILFHGKLVTSCIGVLSTLTKNMGDLETPGSSAQDAQKDKLDKNLPKYKQYSCQYWAKHLDLVSAEERAQLGLCDDGKVHVFFQDHFLFWLEAMSLIGKMSEAVLVLSKLATMLEPHQHPALHASIEDAWRFTLKNRSIIEQAPLQTYVSALIFSPKNSAIRERNALPSWLNNTPDVEENWGPLLHTLEAHGHYRIEGIALSFDAKFLASTCYDSIKLWDPATGALHGTLEGHLEAVRGLAFSRDGQLASISDDWTVRIWDPITTVTHRILELKYNFRGYNLPRIITFTPEGNLAVVGGDPKFQVWDWKAGKFSNPPIPDVDVRAMAFLSDGRLVISYFKPLSIPMPDVREVVVYDPSDGTVQIIKVAPVSKIAVSSDSILALGLKDGTILLHDLRVGSRSQKKLRFHRKEIVSIEFSRDGTYLASISSDGSLHLHNLMTCEKNLIGSNKHGSVIISSDGKLLASRTLDDTVQVWNPRQEAQPNPYKGRSGTVGRITRKTFSFDGKQLAYGYYGGNIRILDSESRLSQDIWTGTTSEILRSIAFSPDGRLLASGISDGTSVSSVHPIRILDIATRNLQTLLEGHSKGAEVLAFSPDIRQLASGASGGSIRTWNVATGVLIFQFKGHSDDVPSIVFSPNGKQLASSGSANNGIRIWDTRSGHLKFTLEGQSLWYGRIRGLAFSYSGDQLASSGYDTNDYRYNVCIWDPVTGSRLQTFHTERAVSKLSYSADGMYIETDSGEIELKAMRSKSAALSPMPRNRWRLVDEWLIHGGRRMLWLPPDVFPKERLPAAQYQGLFVLGNSSGKVTFIEVDPGFSPAEGVIAL